MIGAENELSEPVSGSRKAESSGSSTSTSRPSPSPSTPVAHQNARRSRGSIRSVSGASSASGSTGFEALRRGSMIRSVMNHPSAMMSRLEVAVKK